MRRILLGLSILVPLFSVSCSDDSSSVGPMAYAPGTAPSSSVPAVKQGTAPDDYLTWAKLGYADWKGFFDKDCGGGVARINSAHNPEQTVSEAIGYGMLLAVAHKEQTLFDGLWKYYNKYLDDRGLMHWKIEGCDGPPLGRNSATDAELDVAMALIMAACTWQTPTGAYAASARDLISKIKSYEVETGSLNVLKPGDAFGGAACTNPSYFAPAYYREFALVSPADAAFWTKLAADSYTVLNRATNPTSGLVPDWCDSTGAPMESCSSFPGTGFYKYDAARTPWRIGVDAMWWGAPEAKAWLTKITNFIRGLDITKTGDGYDLQGKVVSGFHTSAILSGFAVGSLAVDPALGLKVYTELETGPDGQYFSRSLRSIALAHAAGLLNRPLCF